MGKTYDVRTRVESMYLHESSEERVWAHKDRNVCESDTIHSRLACAQRDIPIQKVQKTQLIVKSIIKILEQEKAEMIIFMDNHGFQRVETGERNDTS